MRESTRVIIGEDQLLVREGVVRMLESLGVEVVGTAANVDDLIQKTRAYQPDVVITDIEMPSGIDEDGLRAALRLRRELPAMAAIVLSQYVSATYAMELVAEGADGLGYLLKEKVAAPEVLIDAIDRVRAGGSALDSDVIAHLVGRPRVASPLDRLTPREREVLGLMAEGHSNIGIAERLVVTVPAVERHVTGIFGKLGLQPASSAQHRRVLAVLQYLHG